MTLQEYLQSLIKLCARGPNITDQSIIDSVVNGISLGSCGEYLTRRRPKTVTKLFEIMQEYCISDRAKRQKLEEMNEKRKSRNSERSHQKPWHSDQSKQKTVNSVSEEESRETRHHKLPLRQTRQQRQLRKTKPPPDKSPQPATKTSPSKTSQKVNTKSICWTLASLPKTSLQCEGSMLTSKRREEPRYMLFRKKLWSLKSSRGQRGRK